MATRPFTRRLIGKSGAGKTTLLSLLSGLAVPTEVVIPSTVKTISKEAFQNSGITTLTVK